MRINSARVSRWSATIAIVGLVSPASARAATILSVSASYIDVKAAVTKAVAGDTVVVPAGTAVWGSTLFVTKGVTLQGAGIDQTIITSSIANKFSALISFDPASSVGPRFRLTGFTFNGAWKSTCVDIDGRLASDRSSRVDHNKFTNCIQYAVRWQGDNYGIIDHNVFIDNYLCVQVLGKNWSSWEDLPLNPGTANYPYVEDNSFTYTGARTNLAFVIEGGQGGRYVFRYNTITVQSAAVSGGALELFDAHGNQDPVTAAYSPNGSRGTVGVEIYGNKANVIATHRILNLRGGEARVFNNIVTQSGGSGSYINMTEYDGWSYHFLSAYPGYDPVKNTFFWNNKLNNNNIAPVLFSPTQDSVFIQENRDWFRPPYGLASGRPTACTAGSYYASTDTGTVFKCASTNTWSVAYAPYVYPHPQAIGVGPRTGPAPPTNVRIIR